MQTPCYSDADCSSGARWSHVLLFLAACFPTVALAESVQLALTFDDLPWVGHAPVEGSPADAVQRMAAVLNAHGAPATGFVVCERAREDPLPVAAWANWGQALGNHTDRHRDLNSVAIQDWLNDAKRCHRQLQDFGSQYTELLRFPYLHQGQSAAVQSAVTDWLREENLGIAHVTVDTSDWILTQAHAAAIDAGHAARRRAVGEAFIQHVRDAVRHADKVAHRKLGRGMPHILLLHANSVVDDYLDELLLALRADGVEFISLRQALQDPAYDRRDEYSGGKGLSWLYRMEPASTSDVEWDDVEAAAIRKSFSDLLGDAPAKMPRDSITEEKHAACLQDPAVTDILRDAGSSERWRSLLVSQRGRMLLEAYFNGVDAQTPANLKSITKTLTSALLGIAIRQGWISSENDALEKYLPERFKRHPEKSAITLRNLLTMSSGLAPRSYADVQQQDDWVDFVLSADFDPDRRGEFRYDTPVLQLLSASIAKASGQSLSDIANRFLLEPLDTELPYWRRDSTGLAFAGNDAYLTPRGMLAFGELYLRRGHLSGDDSSYLLSRDYVDSSLSTVIEPEFDTINHGSLPVRGYGYLWWLTALGGQPAIAALGHGGQMIVILPGSQRVIVVTSRWPMASSTEHYQHVVRVLNDRLLPMITASCE